jgi:hypothetical protein
MRDKKAEGGIAQLHIMANLEPGMDEMDTDVHEWQLEHHLS